MKKELFQKTTSVLMVFALIVSLFSVQVSATSNNNIYYGICDAISDNADVPDYNEIEAWFNQQLVQSLSPDYVKYLQDVEKGDMSTHDEMPSSIPAIDGEFDNQLLSRTTLPTKYDPRGAGLVTSIKHQSPIAGVSRGICWSYAAVSTIESYLLKQGIERDYSENYYNYYFAEDALITA